jgi:ribosomal protein S18 acetylase RimI-like enzyme|tara:strand:- start:1017 stop:1400 length:384 start_codon:yes stop_codon:yes gene_type:complete
MKEFVLNNSTFWEFIRNLRNDARVKYGFIKQDEITKQEHKKYMSFHGDKFYICLISNNPAGYVGVIDNDIRVATHPDYQKRGVGVFMINELMKRHPEAIAKVKFDNEASVALFEKAGFKKKYYILEK